MLILSILLVSLQLVAAAIPARRSYDTHSYYVLHHDPTTPTGASLVDVAQALDVELVEQAGELSDYWVVRRLKSPAGLTARGESDPVLSRFEALKREAKSPIGTRSQDTHLARRVVSSVDYLSLQTLRQRVKRAPPSVTPATEATAVGVAARFNIKDPLFPKQWHLVNDEFPQHMMNVTGIWAEGFTGKGIISSLVDDGLDYTSEDLSANFVRRSKSVNSILCLPLGSRTLTIRMTSMTTSLYRHPKTSMIITVPDALDKSLPRRTTYVELASPMIRRLQASASSLAL